MERLGGAPECSKSVSGAVLARSWAILERNRGRPDRPWDSPSSSLGVPWPSWERSGDVPERPGSDVRASEPPQIDFGAISARFSSVLGSSRSAARVFSRMFLLSFSLVRHAVPTQISIELSRVLRDLVTQKLAKARFARGLVARPSRHSNAPFPCASHLPPSIYIYIYIY